MPCQMDPYYERQEANREYKELKAEADKVTRLLCWTCKKLINSGVPLTTFPKELAKWYEHHLEVDRKREAKEKAEKEARLNVLLEKKKKLEEEIKELKNA